MSSIAVIGAGVTGLAAAVHRLGAGHDVWVFEAEPRAGGVVATDRRDGWVFERGPQSIRGGNAAVRALLERIGLLERVVPASKAASRRFLLHDGALVPLPAGPLGLLRFPVLGGAAAARVLGEPFVPVGGTADETVAAFVARRIGQGAAEALVDPMVGGIFGGDPALLEMATAMPRLYRWEKDDGSLLLGAIRAPSVDPRGSFTFPGGLAELVDALVAAVGGALRLGEGVERVEPLRGHGYRVYTRRRTVDVDEIVVTVPPEAARRWLPLDPVELPRAPVVAIHLGFRAADVPDEMRGGFGWLVHSRERRDVLGCLWVSDTFPTHAPPDHVLLRVMVGGVRDPQAALLPEGAVIARARDILADVEGITADPVVAHVAHALPGIPQYPPGFHRWLKGLAHVPDATFVGWWYGGIGIADGIAAALG